MKDLIRGDTPLDCGDGLWWVGVPPGRSCPRDPGFNSWLILDGDEAALVNAGPRLHAGALLDRIGTVLPLARVRLLALLGPEESESGAVRLLEREGFTGGILAPGRLRAQLAMAGVRSSLVPAPGTANGYPPACDPPAPDDGPADHARVHEWKFSSGRTLRLLPLPYAPSDSSAVLVDPAFSRVFTGRFLSACETDVHGGARLAYEEEDGSVPDNERGGYLSGIRECHEAMVQRHDILMDSLDLVLVDALPGAAPAVFPVRGRVLLPPHDRMRATLNLSRSASLYLPRGGGNRDFRPGPEYRAPGSGLGLSRDPAAGHATIIDQQAFHFWFIERFSSAPEETSDFGALFIAIDGLMDINREYGRTMGDEALRSLSWILGNEASRHSGAVAIRLNSPVHVLFIPAMGRELAVTTASEIATMTASSGLFMRPLKLNQAVVCGADIGRSLAPARFLERLEKIGLARVAQAEKSGGIVDGRAMAGSDPSRGDGMAAMAAMADARFEIVMVDPDDGMTGFLASRLDPALYATRCFTNGESAWESLFARPPDLVISELFVPRLNGFQLRQKMLEDPRLARAPFIMLSHRKDEESIRTAYSLGIMHYLRKPCLFGELFGLVDLMRRGQD